MKAPRPAAGPFVRATLAALALAAAVAAPAAGPGRAAQLQAAGVAAHIHAIVHDPEVARRIEAWGLTVADVQHDVDAMTPQQRVRLAYVLTRPWPARDADEAADLKARYLVTVSLMRESTLFASMISTGASRLLR